MLTRVPAKSRNQGFSIMELMIAMTVFTIGLGALVVNLVTGTALRESARETSIATEAAQSAVEALQEEDLDRIFLLYNDSTADDPDGVGTGPGKNFAVPGLEAQTGDADGLAGEILFPGDGTTLREDVVDDALGMPRDLNGDGAIDAADHALDFTILPVRVRIAWRGRSGNRSIEILTSISDV